MSVAETSSWEVTERQRSTMLLIPGGTFRMGSDRHYPEEAPVHRVTVDGFWMDRTPVTNRQFREFVKATGYVTFAEIAPDPKDYPAALPHMLKAGSLVFSPPARSSRRAHRLARRRGLCRLGRQGIGWTIVDMKNDWKRVFPFEGK